MLGGVDKIFNPLFVGHVDKIFNPEKMLEYQKKIKKNSEEAEDVELDFDEEEYNREKERQRLERLEKYSNSIEVILNKLLESGQLNLRMLSRECSDDERKKLIPTMEIFREVVIEFLTEGVIDIDELRKEQTEYLMDTSEGFVLNEMLLAIMEDRRYKRIKKIHIFPVEGEDYVYFRDVTDEMGNMKNLKCSNVGFRYEER